MSVFSTLRSANIARQLEWDTSGNIDLSYVSNEFAGEVSEAIEEAVLQITYPDQSYLCDLEAELADVVICIDLIAIKANLAPVLVELSEPLNLGREDAQAWINELGADLQKVCNTIKKLERERLGIAGSRASIDDLVRGLQSMAFNTHALATCFGIDLDRAVVEKFNTTSEKVGLQTLMAYS